MKNKHWWLGEKKFKRVRLLTLYRLSLLFEADCAEGKIKHSVPKFLLWLENYMESLM